MVLEVATMTRMECESDPDVPMTPENNPEVFLNFCCLGRRLCLTWLSRPLVTGHVTQQISKELVCGEGLQSQSGKMGESSFGRTRHGEESGSKWRGAGVVQKVFGSRAVPSVAEADKPLQAREEGHKRVQKDVETNHHTRRWKGADRNARGWKVAAEKRRISWTECKRLREEIEVGGSTAQKVLWNVAKKRMLEDRCASPQEKHDLSREYKAMHEENFLGSWTREGTEGKAEEVEEMRKRTKEEETQSGRSLVVAVVCKRACCVSPSSASGTVCEKVRIASVLSVIIVNSLVDMVCDLDFSVPEFVVNESQTLSVSSKRDISVTLEHERRKKAKASMEKQRCQWLSGTDPRRKVPYKAVPERVRNRAPLPPE